MLLALFPPLFAADLKSGQYEELSLVVKDGHFSGKVESSVGDPSHGGATCTFVFSGTVHGDRSELSTDDGYETGGGTLILREGGVALQLSPIPNACSRTFPMDDLTAEQGYLFTREGEGDDALRYVAVHAERLPFHASANGPVRRAYVVRGDLLTVLPDSTKEWLHVSYVPMFGSRTTTGWVSAAEL
jgi:hypothetical protein